MKLTTLSATLTLAIFVPLGCALLGFAEEAPKLSDEQRATVLEAIESYVRQDSAIKGGFLVVDPHSSQPLMLTLDHVHSAVKPDGDRYLACVDLKDARGQLYDVDVVVALEGDSPRVEAVRMHKVDGKPIAAEVK